MRAKKRTKSPVVFTRKRSAPCPSCQDREALTIDGRPRFIRGQKMTSGCEVCNGSGRVQEALRKGEKDYDAWFILSKEQVKQRLAWFLAEQQREMSS